MSESRLPLGRAEGQSLEFKSSRAVGDLYIISRAVVGMLNANGGEIWIGIREEAELGVAIEPVEHPAAAARRIEDHLTDTVEPQPGEEVVVDRVPIGDGADVVRIRVGPRMQRRPYAQVRKNGRFYWIRTGARHRVMSREEIRDAFPREVAVDQRSDAIRSQLLAARSSILEEGFSGLIGLVQPEIDTSLKLPAPEFQEYLSDPTLSGNRRGGWNFTNLYVEPQVGQDCMALGEKDGPRIEVRSGGGIQFTLPREHLQWKGEENHIWPYILCEYPVSVFRLASTLLREYSLPESCPVWAEISLHEIQGWRLKPFSPESIRYRFAHGNTVEREDPLIAGPLCFGWKEFEGSPDRCAYRLLCRIYEEFGYYAKDMPREFQNDENAFLMSS